MAPHTLMRSGGRWSARALRPAAGCAAIGLAALVGARVAIGHPKLALALPAVVVAAVLCARRPAGAVVTLLVVTAGFGTLAAYTPLSATPFADALLAGLWAALGWVLLVEGRVAPAPLTAPVVCLLAVGVVGALQVGAATDLHSAIRAFRSTDWYVLALPLIALIPWRRSSIDRLAAGIAAVALVVTAYATLRYLTGPTSVERALALQQPYNDNEGSLRLIGSMFSRHQLSAWIGTILPFCVALAAVATARMRLRIAATFVLGVVAIAGTNSRSGALGLALGLVVLVVLLHASRSLDRFRLKASVMALVVTAIVGYAGVSVATSDGGPAAHYTVILTPGHDPAYQARQLKWREAIAAIRAHPGGLGLGSAGGVAERTSRFDSVGAHRIDNSYLMLAYQQGVGVLAVFVVGLVLLLGTLARAATRGADPQLAALAAGGAASLAAFAAIMYTGDFVEGFNGLTAWIVAGVGAVAASRAALAARD
jgi:O-Antigen ligase